MDLTYLYTRGRTGNLNLLQLEDRGNVVINQFNDLQKKRLKILSMGVHKNDIFTFLPSFLFDLQAIEM